jgi:uncharacterized membrane protein
MLIKVGRMIILSQIYKLVSSVWNEEELSGSGRTQSLYLFGRGAIKIVLTIEAYKQNSIQYPSVKFKSIRRGNYLGQ